MGGRSHAIEGTARCHSKPTSAGPTSAGPISAGSVRSKQTGGVLAPPVNRCVYRSGVAGGSGCRELLGEFLFVAGGEQLGLLDPAFARDAAVEVHHVLDTLDVGGGPGGDLGEGSHAL